MTFFRDEVLPNTLCRNLLHLFPACIVEHMAKSFGPQDQPAVIDVHEITKKINEPHSSQPPCMTKPRTQPLSAPSSPVRTLKVGLLV